MGRYLTRGMVVLVDEQPGSRAALDTALAYASKTVALALPGVAVPPGVESVVHPGRRGLSVSEAFRVAVAQGYPWVLARRDLEPPAVLLGRLLKATGRYATKDLTGFAALLSGPEPRPITRILAVVDLSDGDPSGLMVLTAVASAHVTGAEIDVLVLGAPGAQVELPDEPMEALRVSRDRDYYEQARRRAADEGRRARWIVVDDVRDPVAAVLDQLGREPYDLVIDDLGAIRLGARMGRGRRIERALAPSGPGGIARALLEQTEVPVVIVLDAIRLGLVSPAAAKGGAGALLALGMLAAAAPAASASAMERVDTTVSVSQTVDAYDEALDQAASLASPADVNAAKPDTTVDESADEAQEEEQTEEAESDADETDADETDAGETEKSGETDASDDAAEQQATEETTDSADAEKADEQKADESAETEKSEESAGTDESTGTDEADTPAQDQPAEDAPSPVAPADLAPEEVAPEPAPEVDPDSIELEDAPSAGDVAEAEEAADDSAAELDDAQDDFDKAQDAATDATKDVEEAAAEAEAAAAELAAAEAAYLETATQTEPVITDATGVSGALPGGASEEDLASAEAAQAEALTGVEEATVAADAALTEYEEAAEAAVQADAELDAAAAEVTQADAAHQEDAAVADATEDAYEEVMATARVSPVPGYSVTTDYGVSGSAWSSGHHTGADYAAPTGTEVVAAASGTVVYAQNDGGAYGNRIVIEHDDGYYTSYNHLSDIDVSVGQEVTAGDHIGEVGNTGNSHGSHLHFEVTKGGDGWSSGSFVDPVDWLAAA